MQFCIARRAIFLFLFRSTMWSQQVATTSDEAVKILREVSTRLASLSRVSYHSRRELTYPSENYHHVLEGDVYVDFDPKEPFAGATYQVRDAMGFEIYNGSEILRAVAKTQTMQMTPVRSTQDLDRVAFLYNSWLTLRRALPKVIADPGILKSIAGRTGSIYEVEFRIPSAVLTTTGTLSPITLRRDIVYRVTVDGESFLPLAVRQTNSQNDDSIYVEFSNRNLRPAKVPADSWHYTSYKDYRHATAGPDNKLLAAGSTAPPWTLAVANSSGSPTSLAEVLRGSSTRLTLLVFWISHCGYSIDAVPKLNELMRRFGPAGLTVLAINTHDSDDTIRIFAKNNGPNYTLLAHGEDIARQYGVGRYPTLFLVNPAGTIMYAGGFDQERLSAKIAELLR